MNNLRKVSPYLLWLLCFCISCKNKSHHSNDVAAIRQDQDSIVFVNMLPPKAVAHLYDISVYEADVFPITFNGNNPEKFQKFATESLFLVSYDLTKVFLIYPGEKVSIKSNSATTNNHFRLSKRFGGSESVNSVYTGNNIYQSQC